MASQVVARLVRIMRNPHFWLIVAMFAILIVLHYPQQIFGPAAPSSFFGLSRHTVERVLFLLPIIYAGLIFGIRGGLVSLAVALAIMLPRAILVSPDPSAALFETGSVTLIGIVVLLWLESQKREKERRHQALLTLEAAQREVQFNERRLAAINAVSEIVNQSLEIEQVLNGALTKVVEVIDVEVALIFLLDEEAQELELKAYHGGSEEFIAGVRRLKVGEGLNGRVAESGEPLLVKDASHDPRLTREVVALERLHAQLIVPLKSKGKVVGTLCVAMRQPREFLPDEIELLTAIGNEIGIAIENAHLYEQERVIAERLRASEKEYRELFENAHDAICVQDLEGNIIAINRACAQLTGYAEEELRGTKVSKFFSEESLRGKREIEHRLLQGDALDQPYEQRLIRKDGTEAILKLTTSLIIRDGQPKGFQHIARDITEEKRLEENLRFYLQQVTRAQEDERKRIARELHDDTAQALVVLSRQLDSFISAQQRPAQDIVPLEKLREQIDMILEGVRRFSQDLRPSILDDLGLLPALEWLASDLTDHFGISIGVAVLGAERRFSSEVELLLFRIAQEALRNVWRHSGASRAWVVVEFDEGKTILTIRDNGKGFELPKRVSDLASTGKLGLAGMDERARLLGGSLRLQSELGKGTTATVEVPL
jgi:two-component system sensor histidine kinase DegS